MSNAFRLFFTAFFSLAALVLAIVACAGSTKNYTPLNRIYTSQVDLTQATISTQVSSSTLAQISFPGYINIGLWSYCIETSNGTVSSCTSPKGIQKFNLRELLYDNIAENSVLSTIDSASILLPQDLQDKMKYINAVIKCMFITMIIGIVLSFVSLVVCLIRWVIHLRFLQWIGAFIGFFAFVSLLISIGSCTAVLVVIRRILKDNVDEYGIKLGFGRIYMGLCWGSVVAALFGFMFWCSVRSVRRPQVIYMNDPIEKRPLI